MANISSEDYKAILNRIDIKAKTLNTKTKAFKKLVAPKIKSNYSESKLQQDCIKWFDSKYPKKKHLLFAIPNGGSRNPIEGKRLKAEGVRAGVADLMLCVGYRYYNGCFIEMKYGSNKQSDSQKLFQKTIEANGYEYYLCYDFDSFKSKILQYMKK